MIVKLLTEQHLEILSLKGGCTGSSESTLGKMSNCWKSHAVAHIISGLSGWRPTLQSISLISCQQESVTWAIIFNLGPAECGEDDHISNKGFHSPTCLLY